MTQLKKAREGIITPEMKKVAEKEGVSPEFIREGLAAGNIVISLNNRHDWIEPLGIGKGLTTKVNSNIGTSLDTCNLPAELEKVDVSVEAGADTVMDLSTGGDLDFVRKEVLKRSAIPVGTVPIYQVGSEYQRKGKAFHECTGDDMFEAIERNGEDGVDFITVHCGVTIETVERVRKEGRVMGVVSRGGSLLVDWMRKNNKENPLYEEFDRLIEIAKKYDMTLSLGDGFRPGCLADATDRGQVQETIILGELTERAWKEGVQVMIEGPGHVPINQIEANITLQKRLCHNAPFYVLGPLVTDIAAGYDHITCAIGGAIAATAGADFLCYVTPSEHLRLPNTDDVREGIMATRIAAHAADIGKGIKGAMERDNLMAKMRKAFDWEGMYKYALDPKKARTMRGQDLPSDSEVCTMCSELCAMKLGTIDKEDEPIVKKG